MKDLLDYVHSGKIIGPCVQLRRPKLSKACFLKILSTLKSLRNDEGYFLFGGGVCGGGEGGSEWVLERFSERSKIDFRCLFGVQGEHRITEYGSQQLNK